MKRKKKSKLHYSSKIETETKSEKNNSKYIILAIFICILFGFGIYFSLSKKTTDYPYIPPEGEVKIIEANGNMPQTVPTEIKQDNTVGSPMDAERPATIEDLGGDKNTPTNIDELLKDKNIDVSK